MAIVKGAGLIMKTIIEVIGPHTITDALTLLTGGRRDHVLAHANLGTGRMLSAPKLAHGSFHPKHGQPPSHPPVCTNRS